MTTPTVSPPRTRDPIEIVDEVRGIEGCAHGFGQPVLLLNLEIQALAEAPEGTVSRAIDQELELPPATAEPGVSLAALRRALRWAIALQVKAGLPVFDQALTVPRTAQVHTVMLPCLTHASGLLAIRGAVQLANQSLALDLVSVEGSAQQQRAEVAALVSKLAQAAPQGFNALHFLRAAHELGVPWSPLSQNVYQVGWGSRSRLLSSSFTDATPQISTMLARDKVGAAAILRAGGLPVPAHAAVQNEDDAVRHAQALGYPVVVKPADLDGGVGVAARLESPEAVRAAYFAARKHSPRVLVEKHIHGRDYRLHVVGEEVQGILERVPGGVTGDGVQSVKALLEQQNLARKTAIDDRKYLKQMEFDDEARRMLTALGLDAASVPAPGQVVQLRAMANVASGGVPVPLDPAQAHPDNLELALRAARLLRLDVAGVDLLIPDVTRSWMEVGAAICEVNAQPQMFTTLHQPMLRSLLGGGDGRIPVLVVLGEAAAREVAEAVHARLDSPACTAGLAGPEGVWISTHCIARGPTGLLQGGRMLLRDPKVDAVVLSLAGDPRLPPGGWPVDRCEVLVLAATAPKGPPDKVVAGVWLDSVHMLRPRAVVASTGAMQTLRQLGLSLPPGLGVHVTGNVDVASLANASLEALQARGARVE